ncbi:MAG: hypothetical protein ABIJ86_07390, partial [Spirochaetota bacterium]
GKIPAGGEFDVPEERGAELLAKTVQRFVEVVPKPETKPAKPAKSTMRKSRVGRKKKLSTKTKPQSIVVIPESAATSARYAASAKRGKREA